MGRILTAVMMVFFIAGAADKALLKEIVDSCGISQGSYKPMTHEEILAIFQECYE